MSDEIAAGTLQSDSPELDEFDLSDVGRAFNREAEDVEFNATDGITFKVKGEDDSTPEPTGAEQVDGYEKRYKDAQAWGTRVSQEKAELANTLKAQTALITELQHSVSQLREGKPALTVGDGEESLVIPDFETYAELGAWVQTQIAEGKQEILRDLQPVITRTALEREQQAVRSKYADYEALRPAVAEHMVAVDPMMSIEDAYRGVKEAMPDLLEWAPAVNKVINRFPSLNLTIKQAYAMAQDLYTLEAQAPPTSQAPSQGELTADEQQRLRTRSAAYNVERGIGGVDDIPPPAVSIGSPREAVEYALNKIVGGS